MIAIKNRILLGLASIFSISMVSYSQTICLGTDATVCAGSSVTLQDCGLAGGTGAGGSAPYTDNSIPYNPDSFTTGTTVSLSDDSQTGMINIGFNFCFYGNTYTQLIIGSNNFVTFSAGGTSTWVTIPIPTTGTAPMNAIMGPWQDINPGAGGTVRYQMYGTAPFRRFTVTWNNVPMYSCTSSLYSSQIIIYESTNIIETHISSKPLCPTWNGGNAVHGLHNINGTSAVTVAGRNNTQWTTSNEGWRFTPNNLGISWVNTLGQSFPYTSDTLVVSPVPPGTSGWWLEASCSGTAITDTTWLTTVTANVAASSTDDICSASQGTLSATTTSTNGPFTYSWSPGGYTGANVTGVAGGNYTVTITDATGCTSTANVVVGNTPATFTADSTEVSCPGGNDGTATAYMTPVLGNVTYLWDDPSAQTTQTATGLAAGTYNCIVTSDVGCVDTVTVTVTEIPGMIGVISAQSDVSCNSGNDGMITISVTQGATPYTYSWNSSTSTTNIANNLVAGTHTCTITDANGCVITVTGTITEPAPLAITFITPDTQICPEDDINLTATGSGGSSAYTYTWYQGTTIIGTGGTINVDPSVTNTTYCVVLSEACGSPTDQACVTISFPEPIIPSAEPDEFAKCVPNSFVFTNTSSNPSEIATTYWEFGDPLGGSTLTNGADSVSYYYGGVGTYTITMTVTSIYGCVYVDSMVNLIEVLPSPTADFGWSPNPPTIFSTNVHLQDMSSSDVTIWDWTIPWGNPGTSNLSHPNTTFPDGVPGTYPVMLIVETDFGCRDTIIKDIIVVEDILFFAPNAFTPDGDEHNQLWLPVVTGIDIYDYDLFIFNRWGEIIWESHDPSVGWDGTYNGKEVETGSYVWKAIVKDPHKDHRQEFMGTVTILK